MKFNEKARNVILAEISIKQGNVVYKGMFKFTTGKFPLTLNGKYV